MPHALLLSLIAIVINFISRSTSVGISSLFMGKLPDSYNKFNFTKLLTWGGLRGGLSVALAMSTEGLVSNDTFYIILGGVYAIVFFTTVIQGMTMKKVYLGIERSVNGK
jgi:CPA1 family monovalent cation:H+ antiporter